MSRHNVDIPAVGQRITSLTGALERGLGRAAERPENLEYALQTAMLIVDLRTSADPTADLLETWESVVTAMQIASAIFVSATTTAAAVEVRIGGRMHTIPASRPRRHVTADNWLTAFYLAVLCREQGRLTMLSEVPLGLLRVNEAGYDEVIFTWIDVLQTYWQEGPGIGPKLQAAFEGTDPDRPTQVGREHMLKIVYPPVNLLYRFLQEQRAEFNTALVQALELHRDYWSSDVDERSADPEGLVALAPLAMACLAHDAGFPVEVESEFLPTHILRRSWLGEFDT